MMPEPGVWQASLSANIRRSILEHLNENGGHAFAAEVMGIDYSTWWNSLNRNRNPLYEDVARLGQYMKATRNFEPLRLLADALEFCVAPKPAVADDGHDLRHECMELHKLAGDLDCQIEAALADGHFSPQERRVTQRYLQDLREQIVEMEQKVMGGAKWLRRESK